MVDFSKRVALNYDCLRAIAFEINNGLEFSEAIKDLNIVNIERERFQLLVLFKDGSTLINKKVSMDSFSKETEEFSLYEVGGGYAGSISFCPCDIKYNAGTRELYLEDEDVVLGYDDYDLDYDESKKKVDGLRNRGVKKIVINRVNENRLHYDV